jgi:hypothetical protein
MPATWAWALVGRWCGATLGPGVGPGAGLLFWNLQSRWWGPGAGLLFWALVRGYFWALVWAPVRGYFSGIFGIESSSIFTIIPDSYAGDESGPAPSYSPSYSRIKQFAPSNLHQAICTK